VDDPSHPPVVVMQWHPATGALSRTDDTAQPFIRALVPILAETNDVASLDTVLLDIVEKLAAVPAVAANRP
jgi:hypothetical protein